MRKTSQALEDLQNKKIALMREVREIDARIYKATEEMEKNASKLATESRPKARNNIQLDDVIIEAELILDAIVEQGRGTNEDDHETIFNILMEAIYGEELWTWWDEYVDE